MAADFKAVEWDEALIADARRLVRMALDEDLNGGHDLTSDALAPPDAQGEAAFVARQEGVFAGGRILQLVADEAAAHIAPKVAVELLLENGQAISPGTPLARMRGRTRDLLLCERTMLNLLSRLCGVATRTREFVQAIGDAAAQVYDTRKTTPGWRRLEKHAVRAGGGCNHRLGLYDAVLIKDNHLAFVAEQGLRPAEAVRLAREASPPRVVVEIEVDSLAQLRDVLPAAPDIVLLDNMPVGTLQEAVAIRGQLAPGVVLEASGGVSLATIGPIARTGVDRVSVGGLTHAAISLDIGLDWT